MTTDAVTDFRLALEARDLQGMLDALAHDAVLNSPAANGLRFEGREQLAELFGATLETYEGTTVTSQLAAGSASVLTLRARMRGQDFTEMLVLEADGAGRISTLTAYIRPIAGLATVAAVVGQRLARRRGRLRSLAYRALFGALPVMMRSGERVAVGLLRRPV